MNRVSRLSLLTAIIVGSILSPSLAMASDGITIAGIGAVQIDANGNPVVQINTEGSGFYIGSWQRTNGTWSSPEEAKADLTTFIGCVADASDSYSSGGDFMKVIQNLGESFQTGVSIEKLATVGQIVNCFRDSEWASWRIKNTFNSSGLSNEFYASYDKFGAGKHKMFIANIVVDGTGIENANCREVWQNETEKTSICDPVITSINEFEATIPELTASQLEVVATKQAEIATSPAGIFKKSTFSSLAPIDFGVFKDIQKFLVPAGKALAITSVFAVAVSLPTTLLESTLEANRLRIEARLRRLNPLKRKDKAVSKPKAEKK